MMAPDQATKPRAFRTVDLFNIPLLQRLTERMQWLGAREKVLATNIANADTPGYQPKDVVPLDFDHHLQKLAAVEPERTNPAHIVGTIPAKDPVDSRKQRKPYEAAPAGNAVVLEEQMMKMAQTQSDYNEMVNLYKIAQKTSRDNNYEQILRIVNDVNQGNAEGLVAGLFDSLPRETKAVQPSLWGELFHRQI